MRKINYVSALLRNGGMICLAVISILANASWALAQADLSDRAYQKLDQTQSRLLKAKFTWDVEFVFPPVGPEVDIKAITNKSIADINKNYPGSSNAYVRKQLIAIAHEEAITDAMGYSQKATLTILQSGKKILADQITSYPIYEKMAPSNKKGMESIDFYDGINAISLSRQDAASGMFTSGYLSRDQEKILSSTIGRFPNPIFLGITPIRQWFPADQTKVSETSEEFIFERTMKNPYSANARLTISKVSGRATSLTLTDLSGVLQKIITKNPKMVNGIEIPTWVQEQQFGSTFTYTLSKAALNDEVTEKTVDIPVGIALRDNRFGEGEDQGVQYRYTGKLPTDEKVKLLIQVEKESSNKPPAEPTSGRLPVIPLTILGVLLLVAGVFIWPKRHH